MNNPEMVWLAVGHFGSYSDYTCSIIGISATVDGAKEMCLEDYLGAIVRDKIQREQNPGRKEYNKVMGIKYKVYKYTLDWELSDGEWTAKAFNDCDNYSVAPYEVVP